MNSEGVVLWTHEVGSGLVAPDAESRPSGAEDGSGGGDGAGVEVRFVLLQGGCWEGRVIGAKRNP